MNINGEIPLARKQGKNQKYTGQQQPGHRYDYRRKQRIRLQSQQDLKPPGQKKRSEQSHKVEKELEKLQVVDQRLI